MNNQSERNNNNNKEKSKSYRRVCVCVCPSCIFWLWGNQHQLLQSLRFLSWVYTYLYLRHILSHSPSLSLSLSLYLSVSLLRSLTLSWYFVVISVANKFHFIVAIDLRAKKEFAFYLQFFSINWALNFQKRERERERDGQPLLMLF